MTDCESTLKEKRMDISIELTNFGREANIYFTKLSHGYYENGVINKGLLNMERVLNKDGLLPAVVISRGDAETLMEALNNAIRPKKEAVAGYDSTALDAEDRARVIRSSGINQFDNLVFKPTSSHIEAKDYRDNQEERNGAARDLLGKVKSAPAPIGLPYDWSLDCSKELTVDVCHWSTKLDKAVSSMWNSFSDSQKKAIATQCNKAVLKDAQERLDKMLTL